MTQIVFQGKTLVEQHHLVAPHHQLIGSAKKSLLAKGKNPSLHGNLVLHGDNLLALKALLPTHGGKVNCVYIDPPYNTGNEGWRYNDKVNSPLMKEWLGKMVDADDMSRHDKWLCMMWPRLTLLRELMADDGVIFISIDDNEVHHLRMMMDEIFGDENFIANVIWRKKAGGGQDSDDLAREHEYILCYSKTSDFQFNFRTTLSEIDFKKTHNGRKCKFIPLEKWGSNALRTDRPTMYYPIKDPTGKDFYPMAPNGKPGNWRTNPKNLDSEHIKWDWNVKKKRYQPKEVVYYDESSEEKIVKDRTIFYDLATTTDATLEQQAIFGEKRFDNSKPMLLVYRLISIATKEDALILDSFAGSGTTAQAVLELNKEDGGNRRFALVECEDYADKLTAERVRRVIRGAPQAKNPALKAGLGGEFSYWELGGEIELKAILDSGDLPSYEELARYVFFTATGEQWNEKNMRKREFFAGESRLYEVYLYYKNSADFLASAAFDFEMAEKLPKKTGKQRLVFAPALHVNVAELAPLGIKFCQLPFEIYRLAANGKKAKKKK